MRKPSFPNPTGKLLLGLLLFSVVGCEDVGHLVSNGVLITDAMGLSAGDLAGPGPQVVFSERIEMSLRGESLEIALYEPAKTKTPLTVE